MKIEIKEDKSFDILGFTYWNLTLKIWLIWIKFSMENPLYRVKKSYFFLVKIWQNFQTFYHYGS
jgi:hypothetical protein